MGFRVLYRLMLLVFALVLAPVANALVELSENELSDISGQASLINIDKYDFNGNNFYQVKLNATIQNSINMDRLTLRDSSNNPQIDIENFSINGGTSGAVTSATMVNPYVEFAFAGSIDDSTHNARNREIIGMRLGADSMTGWMSFGQQDNTAPRDGDTGINMFHGYMETTALRGTVQTLDSSGGTSTTTPTTGGRCCFQINNAAVRIQDCGIFGCTTWATGTLDMPNTTMRFPSVQLGTSGSPVTFLASGLTVNTTSGPVNSISVNTDILNLPTVPFQAIGSGNTNLCVGFICIDLTLQATSNGNLQNLRAVTQFSEEFRFMHRAELQGNGFYLSAQNRDVKWRGSPAADTAQQGWWMSVSRPLEFGNFTITNVVLPDSSLQEIANATATYLQANPVTLTLGDAIGGALSGSTTVNLGNLDLSSAAPINIPLTNQNLGPSQQEIVNCWNGVLGC